MRPATIPGAARTASDTVYHLGNKRFAMMHDAAPPTKAATAVLIAHRRAAVAALQILDAFLDDAKLAAPVNVAHVQALIACSAEDIAFDWNVARDLRTFADSLAPEGS